MRKSNEQLIGVVIRKLLKTQKLVGRLLELDAIQSCEEVLGKELMKYVNEITFKKGKLIIKVKSAAVRNELSYQKSEILNKINQISKNEIVKEVLLG
jgi:hypothetical protein|tara:strand:- start:1980 stop:2270 length:291 start_codon:yes stop_codon:yes gene_type:complete